MKNPFQRTPLPLKIRGVAVGLAVFNFLTPAKFNATSRPVRVPMEISRERGTTDVQFDAGCKEPTYHKSTYQPQTVPTLATEVITALGGASSNPAIAGGEPLTVRIVPQGQGYQLLRNGQPFFIKGVCGSTRLDELVAAGGNSIRTYSPGSILDQAHQKGITVLLGLNIGKPRHGFAYSNAELVADQIEKVRQNVLKYKDHPALLMWVLGNEVELSASKEERIRVWKAINEIAQTMKTIDKGHPIITVVAGLGGNKLSELDAYCPTLDGVGINAYAAITSLPSVISSQGWKRPWLVTEFGPRGHWEVAKTPWGLPIEDTSTMKADLYLKAYRRTVEAQPACLGSYVFLWGQKQEKTHTWYGMFLPEGNRLGAVDAMTMAWTGKWPDNRCPQIGAEKIKVRLENESTPLTRYILSKGSRLRCTVDAIDPDGDPVSIRWDLRRDVSDNPNRGGDREPPTSPLNGAIISSEKNQVLIQLPEDEGNYRIFVYVFDRKGSAATANLPVQVKTALQ